MKITVAAKPIEQVREQLVVVGIYEGEPSLSGAAADVDKRCPGLISTVVQNGDFTGRLSQTMLLYAEQGLAAKRVLLVGLGKKSEFTIDRLRASGAVAARFVRERGIAGFALPVSSAPLEGVSEAKRAGALAEGILLGLYRFDAYKTAPENNGKKRIRSVTILADGAAGARREVRRRQIVAESVCLARDLVSRPGNEATPRFLARTARALARTSGLSCKVLGEKDAGKLGMRAFLSVGRGSAEPSQCIVLEYRPKKAARAPAVVLVGKAITFDSGGISLKPAQNMEEMKTDMSGGAAVLATLRAAAELELPVHLVGIVPAAENLPGGTALKPGDVITSMSGTTIEILSTDAEGRLVLADALTYARRYRPSAIIDLATLTGACIVALGNDVSGIMSNDDDLAGRLRRAGDAAGERLWRLPLYDEYGELIKSDIADIKNVGGRAAGTITAAYFLKHFVDDTPWAHLDIAGTAWAKKDRPCTPKGATGVGVRVLIEYLEDVIAGA